MRSQFFVVSFVVTVILWILSFTAHAQNKTEFVSGLLVVKLKESHREFLESPESVLSQNDVLQGVLGSQKMFPYKTPLSKELAGFNSNSIDLSLVYLLNIDPQLKIESAINQLINSEIFEYVERKKINYTSFTPNDSEINNQGYLNQINAFLAWDITTGSAAVKVGVVDTGTDMDHPDLQTEMTTNNGDPINGIDDDGDGYVDNFNGWDFIDNDHVPQAVTIDHGVHVSGIAAAKTNNGEGVASVGFETQFMPIRVGDGTAILYGYEGIVYAADMGCDIINCSWGSFGASQFEEDVINYATFNKDALVVCAAGNQGVNQKYYPAAYENAFAVASVNSSDGKSSFTNYGYWVDISAPGEGVYSTVNDGLYNYNTGTSMATPVVSGAAALVKAVYPQLSALQIAERLKSTSVNIDGINSAYSNKIGKGRLDVKKAVTGLITDASVVFGNSIVTNKTDDVFKGNDSLFISGTFTNYLNASNNVSVTLSSASSHVQLNHTIENLGIVGSSVQMNNYATPFSCKILDTAPDNELTTFEITVTDGQFVNRYYLEVNINVDYRNVEVNRLSATIGSLGQFGYNNHSNTQGLGVQFDNGESQLYEGGLMIGTSEAGLKKVVDRVRSTSNNWDDDFSAVENVHEVSPSPNGIYYVEGIFNDSIATSDSIGLTVLHSAYASDEIGHENYVVLEYAIVNSSPVVVNDLYVGLFADFDIENYSNNKVATDDYRFLTYTSSTDPSTPLFGVLALSAGVFNSYGLDNVSGGGGGVDIRNGFYTADKYQTLSSSRKNAGNTSATGNDVIQVTSVGGFTLLPGDTVVAAFALLAAERLFLLEEAADSAYFRYTGNLPNSVGELSRKDDLINVYPNPTNSAVTIDITKLHYQNDWSFKVVNVAGQTVFESGELIGSQFEYNTKGLKSGIYFIHLQVDGQIIVTKLIKNS